VGSNTLKVATHYRQLLQQRGIEARILSLHQLNTYTRDEHFIAAENSIIAPTTCYIFITPEYNGSIPGVLKMLFDTCKSHRIWWHKKALITGISSGRAGNLRGNDHLAAILNFLKITVHPNQLPISSIDTLMDENGHFTDANTIKVIQHQLDEFLAWAGEIKKEEELK
jgi:chromate reductase, NAD(P)H dehydrogenase (quinone)